MTAILMRSALVFHGLNPAPDVAYVISDLQGRRAVTWADVMLERRERQRRQLERIRQVQKRCAYKVWVAYFDMNIFGGWQAFLENRDGRVWIDRDGKWLIAELMQLFPLVPLGRAWNDWEVEFARRYRKRKHCRRPLGVAYVFREGNMMWRADG